MKLKHFLSVSVLLFSALQLQATVYYASPTGTDATGTSKAAPGSITAMIGKLKAGDQLILLDGQYDLKSLIKISQSGTADQYITIVADDGAKPILDFRELPNGKNQNAIQLTGNYFHLKGFTVRYSGYKGIWVEKGKYNILENLEVYGCCDSGIQLRSGGHAMPVRVMSISVVVRGITPTMAGILMSALLMAHPPYILIVLPIIMVRPVLILPIIPV